MQWGSAQFHPYLRQTRLFHSMSSSHFTFGTFGPEDTSSPPSLWAPTPMHTSIKTHDLPPTKSETTSPVLRSYCRTEQSNDPTKILWAAILTLLMLSLASFKTLEQKILLSNSNLFSDAKITNQGFVLYLNGFIFARPNIPKHDRIV